MTASHPAPAERPGVERLQAWEALRFGVFFHFGMSTFSGRTVEPGKPPAPTYAPSALDVGQWLDLVCELGARYAVLVCKHNSGFCLWPTETTPYHVGNSSDGTDVVAAFVEGCRRRGLRCGLYYNWLDLYHLLERPMPVRGIKRRINEARGSNFSDAYWRMTCAQLEELFGGYGPVDVIWIDRGGWVAPEHRVEAYNRFKRLQPASIVLFNQAFHDGTVVPAWPTDVTNGEETLPPECGHEPWKTIEGERHYVPMEVAYRLTHRWFDTLDDELRPMEELVGICDKALGRNANFLVNLPPDRRGIIPEDTEEHARELIRRSACLG